MNALRYRLNLDEPVLATQPHVGEENSASSLSYIPGAAIRGAMIRAYLARNDTADLAGDEEGRRLFLDGRCRYLHAYPEEPISGERMLPVPRSWFAAKDDVHGDRFIAHDAIFPNATSPAQPKSPSAPFCHIGQQHTVLVRPERFLVAHNASRDRRRKTAGSSQVFRYEALADGQALRGVILADNPDDLATLSALLNDPLFVGGSQSSGYGRVSVDMDDSDPDWHEYRQASTSPLAGHYVVTTLSDLIISPMMAALEPDSLAARMVHQAERLDAAYRETNLVGGWNRTWGLPLPQDVAIAAGSVITVPRDAVDDRVIAGALRDGIGERRAEGFGRIAVDWQTNPSVTCQVVPPRLRPPSRAQRLSRTGQTIAQDMAKRRLRKRLEERLVQRIIELATGLPHRGLPSPSQMARIRLAAREEILSHRHGQLERVLSDMEEDGKDWPGVQLGDGGLFAWVRETSASGEGWLEDLFGLDPSEAAVAGSTAHVDEAMEREFRARLVDGVMKLAIERKKDEGEPEAQDA